MSGVASKLAKKRAQAAGLGSNTNPIKYLNQDFEALRSKCLSSGQLFCDPTFPAGPESVGYNRLGPNSPDTKGIEWKRPTELCSQPKFIVSGATISDIRQGYLGNCWLLAAAACVTLNKEIMAQVIYPEQSFEKDYAGIFHFQLWQYGQWVDVVIDDFLPSCKGNRCFGYSADEDEYWSSLLEKAYAKLHGCYEHLIGGVSNEGFEDLTGGIAQNYELKQVPPDFFKTMKRALSRNSLLGAMIAAHEKPETETKENLFTGHLYSIIAAEEIKVGENLVQLLRIRNPWGCSEWKGAWSDGSKEWNDVQPEDRDKLHRDANDGEFWMTYSDFTKRYTHLEICNLTPDSLSSDHVGQWTLQQFDGSWKADCTAGGFENQPDTFWTNPQYKITLLEEGNDPDDGKVTCTILVALMQKHRRRFWLPNHAIGFNIYKVPKELEGSQNLCLKKDFFDANQCCASSGTISNIREVNEQIRLPPGEYLIVPFTYNPGETADFLLRVYTEKQSKMREMCHTVTFSLSKQEEILDQDIDASIRSMFSQFSGVDMKISVDEFRTILNSTVSKFTELKTDGFSVEACRQMVELMVDNGSARVGLVELQLLWNKITKWLEIFKTFDQDKSGNMNSYEMRLALESAGFNLNNELIEMLVDQYGDEKTVGFDKFILCLFRLEDTLGAFRSLDTDGTGFAKLDASEWVYMTMQKGH